jgi:uncharacterized repeat protein (TIGR01451 family)
MRHFISSKRGTLVFQAILAGLLQCAGAIPALAEEISSVLSIETIAESRLIDHATGRVEFAATTKLNLGDEIFYTVRVRNVTDAPLRDVIVSKEVPRNTHYVADSAVGPATIISFSVDGGTHFALPDALTAKPGATRPVEPSDYTHIRWQLRHPLAPGATALLRFRSIFQ